MAVNKTILSAAQREHISDNWYKRLKKGKRVKYPPLTDQRLTGIVIPSDWDDSGNVLELTLQADDEQEYRLEGKGLGKYIQERVEAWGKVHCPANGRKLLKVIRIGLI